MRQSKGLLAAAGASTPYSGQVAFAVQDSSFIGVYTFETGVGFGTKYSAPSTLPPSGLGRCVGFSPDGATIGLGYNANANTLYLYPWSSSSGFGTRFPNGPSQRPYGGTFGVAFDSTSSNVFGGGGGFSQQGLETFTYSSSTGYGTRYTPPSPTDGTFNQLTRDIAVHPSDNAVAIAGLNNSSQGDLFKIYPFTPGTGYGTQYSTPATMPTGPAYSVEFSPNGDFVAVGEQYSPCLSVYPFSLSTGIGTKIADPSTVLPNFCTVYRINWSPKQNAIGCANGRGSSSNPQSIVSVWAWSSSGFGAKYSNPSTTPNGTSGKGFSFSPDGASILFGTNLSPFVYAYEWSSSGFGSKYADPSPLPTDDVNDISFNLNP